MSKPVVVSEVDSKAYDTVIEVTSDLIDLALAQHNEKAAYLAARLIGEFGILVATEHEYKHIGRANHLPQEQQS